MKPQEILTIPIISYLHLINSSPLFSCEEGAPSPDGNFYSILCHLHPTASAFLLDLYKLIFIRGIFRSIWRKSIVVPIPKQGKDLMVDSNQRKISMTCNTYKLKENGCKSTSLGTGSVRFIASFSSFL